MDRSEQASHTAAPGADVRLDKEASADRRMPFRDATGPAARTAHVSLLRNALREALQPLVPAVRATLDLVLRRPEQFFDASDVALQSGLSRRHLDRILRGMNLAPAKNWVVGARAWHAAFLLVCGRCSAEETASRLGYADSKALRRHLATVWSASPTKVSCADLDTLLQDMVRFLRTREEEEGVAPAQIA